MTESPRITNDLGISLVENFSDAEQWAAAISNPGFWRDKGEMKVALHFGSAALKTFQRIGENEQRPEEAAHLLGKSIASAHECLVEAGLVASNGQTVLRRKMAVEIAHVLRISGGLETNPDFIMYSRGPDFLQDRMTDAQLFAFWTSQSLGIQAGPVTAELAAGALGRNVEPKQTNYFAAHAEALSRVPSPEIEDQKSTMQNIYQAAMSTLIGFGHQGSRNAAKLHQELLDKRAKGKEGIERISLGKLIDKANSTIPLFKDRFDLKLTKVDRTSGGAVLALDRIFFLASAAQFKVNDEAALMVSSVKDIIGGLFESIDPEIADQPVRFGDAVLRIIDLYPRGGLGMDQAGAKVGEYLELDEAQSSALTAARTQVRRERIAALPRRSDRWQL